jgi:hypothetical protein
MPARLAMVIACSTLRHNALRDERRGAVSFPGGVGLKRINQLELAAELMIAMACVNCYLLHS